MADIILPGAPIDLDVNKAGDLIYLSESRALVFSLSRKKDSSCLSQVTLPVNDMYAHSTKADLPFMTAKRVWWLPSNANSDNILLLTTSLKWIIYSRAHGTLQWTKSCEFCPGLDEYFKYLEGVKCNKFVEMVIVGPVLSEERETDNVHEFQRHFADEMNTNHGIHNLIDDNSMPDKYYLGTVSVPEKKIRRKRNRIKIKTEVMKPAIHVNSSKLPESDVEEEPKPVIKQLTKTSSTGEKLLVTYVMDSKQDDEQLDVDDCEEKVKCVCGATEENSSEDEEWVECDLCHTWQHVDCVAYFPEVQNYFHCDNCLKDAKGKSSKRGNKKAGSPKKTINRTHKICESVNESQSRPLTEPNSEKKAKNGAKGCNEITTGTDKDSVNDNCKSVEDVLKSDSDECNEATPNSDSSYGIAHRGNHINCPCGASDSDTGEEWVQCDECDKWQHQLCVNYADEDKTHYQCPSCKQILTFFANKKYYDPISTLAAKNKDSSVSQSKYRIPKLSTKDKNDGFKVVGSSSCSLSSSLLQHQPVYLPKSLNGACIIGLRKSTVGETEAVSNSSQSTSQFNSGSRVLSQSSSSNNAPLRNMGNIDITNGIELLTEITSDDAINSRPSISFAIVLCTDCLLVLRGYSLSSYQISTKLDIQGRDMCMMTIWSNSGNTEHQVAMVDYNSGEIMIWKLSFSDDKSQHYSDNVSSLPTLVLTGETVASIGGETIEQIMWLNKTQLLIYSMNSVCCYDIVALKSCWCTDVNFSFVVDWFLQSDKQLIIFDDQGSNIVINTANGDIVQQNIADIQNDLVINVKISPSNLLRYEIRVPRHPLLQFATPCKLSVNRNVLFSQQHDSQNILTREHQFLDLNKNQTEHFVLDEKDYKISDESLCPICKCKDLTLSESPFEVTCSNKHSLFMDPVSLSILDPFSAQECRNCKSYNAETAEQCGACKQSFKC